MIGTLQYSSRAPRPAYGEHSIDEAREELVRAIKRLAGMNCFASELSSVCPEIYCRWRDDCYRLTGNN